MSITANEAKKKPSSKVSADDVPVVRKEDVLTPEQEKEYIFIMDKAKTQLLLNQPFYANLLLRLPWEYTNRIPIAAATEDTVWINLAGMMKLTDKNVSKIQFVLAHEVMHIAFMHVLLAKQQALDPELSNIAMDLVINQLLIDGSVGTAPDSIVKDEDIVKKFDYDWFAIYNHLKKNLTGKDGKYKGGLILKGGKCIPFDSLEKNDKDANGNSKGEDGSGKSDKQIESEIKDIVASAATTCRMAGKMPSNMERFVDQFLAPKVCWKEELSKYLTQWMESTERGYERLNRKTQHIGLCLPSNITEPGIKEIVIAMDTSGSCYVFIEQFCGEINAIKQTYGLKIRVVYADCNVASEEIFEPEDDLKMNTNGGGGTDFAPAIYHVNKLVQDNEVSADSILVYFTDLEGGHATHCDIPVLWCVVGGLKNVPFGDVIPIK